MAYFLWHLLTAPWWMLPQVVAGKMYFLAYVLLLMEAAVAFPLYKVISLSEEDWGKRRLPDRDSVCTSRSPCAFCQGVGRLGPQAEGPRT